MTRLIGFTSAFAIAASAAMAGDSVLYIKSKPSKGSSIISYNCDECPELKPDFVAPDVHGVEVQEHEVDGQKRIVQHDNMMGGSAVRIVKTGNTQDNYAGQTVTRVPGGTLVTSGAPVVDSQGCCIGVLSASDFIDSAKRGVPSERQQGVWQSYYVDWHIVDIESLPRERVKNHMTADPVTIESATPLQTIARMMIDADIHRLVVVDDGRRPIGLVSSTDIVAAVANPERSS